MTYSTDIDPWQEWWQSQQPTEIAGLGPYGRGGTWYRGAEALTGLYRNPDGGYRTAETRTKKFTGTRYEKFNYPTVIPDYVLVPDGHCTVSIIDRGDGEVVFTQVPKQEAIELIGEPS